LIRVKAAVSVTAQARKVITPEVTMNNTASTRPLIFLLRIAMAWTFLYAASHQVFVSGFTVAGFLSGTKTFHDFFAVFTAPAIAPTITFLVAYGHLLIGLSLLSGLLVRVSSAFGIGLMLIYWMAHMDFPYISNSTNLLVDEHIVYALVLGLLIATHAGHILGLDGWVSQLRGLKDNKLIAWAAA
jgi:thiosulfate dehydrogenase [quinone] large subunit